MICSALQCIPIQDINRKNLTSHCTQQAMLEGSVAQWLVRVPCEMRWPFCFNGQKAVRNVDVHRQLPACVFTYMADSKASETAADLLLENRLLQGTHGKSTKISHGHLTVATTMLFLAAI